jgi:transcriptional regulator with XRE-family HTH domain
MQNHTSIRSHLREKMRDKDYRDGLVEARISTNIAAQVAKMRESRNWTQGELAQRTKMAQSRISLLENPDYEGITIATLKRLASAFDVALMVRFISYEDWLDWATNQSDDLNVPSFSEEGPSALDTLIAGTSQGLLAPVGQRELTQPQLISPLQPLPIAASQAMSAHARQSAVSAVEYLGARP